MDKPTRQFNDDRKPLGWPDRTGPGLGALTPPESGAGERTLDKRDRKTRWIRRALDGLPDVRARKILAIKKAVAEGVYRVPEDQVAEALVREAARDAVQRGKAGLDRWPQG